MSENLRRRDRNIEEIAVRRRYRCPFPPQICAHRLGTKPVYIREDGDRRCPNTVCGQAMEDLGPALPNEREFREEEVWRCTCLRMNGDWVKTCSTCGLPRGIAEWDARRGDRPLTTML